MGGHASALFPGLLESIEGATAEKHLSSITEAKEVASESRQSKLPNDADELIREARAQGKKISPDAVVKIAKDRDGNIIWLESGLGGKGGSGLAHIIEVHGEQFAQKGISNDELPDYLFKALLDGKVVGMQRTRTIYEFEYRGSTQRVAINVSSNGYIVGANPRSTPKER